MGLLKILALSYGLIVIAWPSIVSAQDPILSSLVITEIQTESETSANEEFVELYNPTDLLVSLATLTIQYRSAAGTSWQDKAVIDNFVLSPGGSTIVATQGYLEDVATYFWSGSGGQLAATGGNIRVIGPEDVVFDTVSWGTGIFGEASPATKATKGNSIHRLMLENEYIDTNNNFADFYEDTPDPVASNELPTEPPIEVPPAEDPEEVPGSIDPVPDPADPAEEEPPTLPVSDSALLPLVISELMINPESPELDSEDEWIELYNPNDSVFELEGYSIQTGSSYSYEYLFGTSIIQPFGYMAFLSSDTGLVLSNTSGAVRLLDKDEAPYGLGVTYADVEEGNTYALRSDGTWAWTTTPTKSEPNIFTTPQIVTKAVATKAKTTTKKATAPKTTKVATTKASKAPTAKKEKPAVVATTTEETPPSKPTRPLLLAGFALVAILYGLYEYRQDFRNFIWKLRRDIETRRENRSGLQGR